MKKMLSVLMAAVLLFCACGISAFAAEEPVAEPRASEVSVSLNRLWVSSGTLRYDIAVEGTTGTTRVGFKNAMVYRYTGTYWAYEGAFNDRYANDMSYKWQNILVPNVGSGTYHVVCTAYAVRGGVEYSMKVTSPSVVL